MKKVGIIRCQQTEDLCPGVLCFKAVGKGELAFEKTGPVQIIGMVSCGGCPGKRAIARAKKMVAIGADIIALASCIKDGSPIDFPCPHYEIIKKTIETELKDKVELINWTH